MSESEAEFLQQYNIHNYEVPLATVDIAIFTVQEGKLQVLLVQRGQHPAKGQWALPGGFVDLKQDENLLATAKRKLAEKTGVLTPYLEQVESVGNGVRDPRGWSITVTYFALLDLNAVTLSTNSPQEQASWHDLDALPTLAFDHQQLLNQCLERLRSKVLYTSIPINLLPELFTLSDLQNLYEVVLGQPLEKKAFRRRMLEANILQETDETRSAGARPAKLYRRTEAAKHYFFARSLSGPRR